MADKLLGAFVSAWVWVELPDEAIEWTDQQIADLAREAWSSMGDNLEFDERVTVSRSFEEG